MYRSFEQAKDELGPYDGLLNEIVTGGWRTYGEKHPHRFQDFLARNQADLVHRYMELRARVVLADVPGFELSPFGEQTFWMRYRDLYVIRLHLLEAEEEAEAVIADDKDA
ncbi:MAG: hypothetical protein H0U59_08690 [Gemmatimonadaceae bacterium]|nr:hypothetical protein [Gemmatimonadaceae bacterium]